MGERGYIAVARSLLKHPVVGAAKPYSGLEAWLWLLFNATWKPHRVAAKNGQMRGVVALERGQLTYARSYLAEAWGWSEKRVHTFLDRLQREGQIELQKGRLQTVVSICNYDDYQTPVGETGRQSGRRGDWQQAGRGPEEEQGKKGRKERTRSLAAEPEGFAEWYSEYPRKAARQAAVRAFRNVVPSQISPEALMKGTRRYASNWSRRPKHDLTYCPYPATWLNSGQFLDIEEPTADASGAAPVVTLPVSDPNLFTEADWHQRLELYVQGRPWSVKHWGPAPGDPGCLCSPGLLNSVEFADDICKAANAADQVVSSAGSNRTT